MILRSKNHVTLFLKLPPPPSAVPTFTFIPAVFRNQGPLTLGHEFMGMVKVGKDVKNLKRGDRVVVPFPIACGHCFFCNHDVPGNCENSDPEHYGPEGGLLTQKGGALFGYTDLYGGYDGGQAEYVRVPYGDYGPRIVPDNLTDEQVLFLTDIFPTGYTGVDWGEVKGGETVAIFGSGPVGIMAAKSAWLRGAGAVGGTASSCGGVAQFRGPTRRRDRGRPVRARRAPRRAGWDLDEPRAPMTPPSRPPTTSGEHGVTTGCGSGCSSSPPRSSGPVRLAGSRQSSERGSGHGRSVGTYVAPLDALVDPPRAGASVHRGAGCGAVSHDARASALPRRGCSDGSTCGARSILQVGRNRPFILPTVVVSAAMLALVGPASATWPDPPASNGTLTVIDLVATPSSFALFAGWSAAVGPGSTRGRGGRPGPRRR